MIMSKYNLISVTVTVIQGAIPPRQKNSKICRETEPLQRDQAHFTDSFPTLSLRSGKVVFRLNSKNQRYWNIFLQEPRKGRAVCSLHRGENCSFKSSKEHSSGPEGLTK